MKKLQKEQACQLYIEQEIEAGLADGKTKYAIGQEISLWIGKLFKVEVKPHTITQRAHRIEQKIVTNVTNSVLGQPETDTEAQILKQAAIIKQNRRAKQQQIVENIKKDISLPIGLYETIVIDPPWPMKKIERDVRPNQVGFDYPTMTEDELSVLPIPIAENSHIFLWTTQKFLPMAIRLLGIWSFRYVCCFTWHKSGGFQPIGLPQYNSEFVVYARHGTPKFKTIKAFNTCFVGERHEHSVKPTEFYEMICRVTVGPRLDMFNRRDIEGFTGWGNESSG